MKVKCGGQVHNIARRSADAFEVDGITFQASATPAGPSRFDGRTASRLSSAFVVRDGDRVLAQVGGRKYTLVVVNRAAASLEHGAAPGDLEAPMPGRVIRVAVGVGDSVRRGQELIVVEAMKMENALVAPSDGVVKSLDVKVDDMVAPGTALVVIEPAS